MSSDFYDPCLSRNLVRIGVSGYQENAQFLLLNAAADVVRYEALHDRSTASFVAFPDFDLKRRTDARTVSLEQYRLHALAASLLKVLPAV